MDIISSTVRNKLRALASPPVAFEALWDGDSDGWHLAVFAVVSDGPSVHRSVLLFGFDEPGGDFRLFRNLVPPWIECQKATLVGEALSAEFGVPFHFPAPQWPEDDCPHWWELGKSYPCSICGIALLQRDPCPWRGVCYRCHLTAEQASKDALLTPEERAGPRCHICGLPAKETVRSYPRCDSCIRKYEDYSCSACHSWTMILRTESHTDRCSQCEMIHLLQQLTPIERLTIREAGKRSPFLGIKAARPILRCDINDARLAVHLLVSGAV